MIPPRTPPPPHVTPAPGTRIRPTARAAVLLLALLFLALALGYRACTDRSRVVFDGRGEFGRVRVVESAGGLRSLYTGQGRALQSAVIPGRPRHLELAYTRVATVGLALVPPEGRLLYVGLGGGAMPMYARQALPEAHVEAVEIDPLIVRVARRYFGLRPDSQLVVHTADGRALIERAPPGRYHLIVLDAFADDEVPYALTTRQFLEAVRARLAPGGVVVSNLWSANPLYPAMVATYQSVFPEVRLIRVDGRAQRILVAGVERGLDRAALMEASRVLARRTALGFDLEELVRRGYERPGEPAAAVLEDR